ncbi:hypothetical protein ABPG72_003855 [Tetrahymena utriculariae]
MFNYYGFYSCTDSQTYQMYLKNSYLLIWFIPSSYFTYDMIIKIYLKKLTSWYFIHHSLAILLSYLSYYTQSNIIENSLILYYSTFFNLPMNIRDVLRFKKQKDTLIYHIVTVLFICCYFYGIVKGMTYLQRIFNFETHSFLIILSLFLRIQAIYTLMFRLSYTFADSCKFINNRLIGQYQLKSLNQIIF